MSIRTELWEFPHTMTLKVMGAASTPLEGAVTAILSEHLEDFDATTDIRITASRKGNYISVNARVIMRDADQVTAIYAALDECEHVRVVF